MYLSHFDCNRFFERCVEADGPARGTAVIVQAASRPTGIARMDLAPARDEIGYLPRDTWPEGLPFPHA
jgi:hypothetical protein